MKNTDLIFDIEHTIHLILFPVRMINIDILSWTLRAKLPGGRHGASVSILFDGCYQAQSAMVIDEKKGRDNG